MSGMSSIPLTFKLEINFKQIKVGLQLVSMILIRVATSATIQTTVVGAAAVICENNWVHYSIVVSLLGNQIN